MKDVKMCGLLVAMLALAGPVRATTVIDFEDWTGGSDPKDFVVSRGYAVHGLVSVYPDPTTTNPTNALHLIEYTAKILTTNAVPFTVESVDLHEGLGDTVTVELVGDFPGAGYAFQTFSLDGDPATFESFNLTGFTGITSLYFYGRNAQGGYSAGFSIDNIVVPEPGVAILIVFGTAVISTRRRVEF